MKASFVAD